MAELTFDMQPSPLAARDGYYPLRFRIGPPSKGRVRSVAAAILASYHQPLSYKQWRKGGPLVVTWTDTNGEGKISKPMSWIALSEYLSYRETFDPAEFALPPLLSGWLDASLEGAQPFYAPANEADEALTIVYTPALSPDFPVQPALDREGRAFSSLQLMLLNSWIEVRKRLVEQSDLLFQGYDWLRDLFSYLTTVVSAVDNTLHQMYYRAQYEGGRTGLQFDPRLLGNTFGRRIEDKLAWVGQITGRPLDDCQSEVKAFVKLKDVRNHLSHFDPPVLAFTIEDVAAWLNATEGVARLLSAIRKRLNEPLCVPLVTLLLSRWVDWYPFDPAKRRVPQPLHSGYASSCWPAAK